MTRPVAERAGTLALFLANGLGIGAWAVEVPRIKDALALSDTALGLSLFAFALGAIVSMPLAGRLSAWLGSGRASAYAGLAFVALLPLPALAPNLALLCAALLALGAANGAMDVAMNGHASAVESAWRAPIMSSFHAAWSVGGLVGSAGGAALQRAGVGVPGGLLLPDVAIVVLVLAATSFTLRDIGPRASVSGSAFTLPSPQVMKLAALAFLCMLIEGAIADWSAVYLSGVLAAATGAAALGYSSYSFAMAACRFVGDAFARRFGPKLVVAAGGVAAAAGLALVLGLPSLVTACAGFALVGLGVANIVPLIFSAAGRQTAPPALGVAMAATAGYSGFLIGPPLIGFVAGVVGLRLALCVLVLATAAVALFGSRAVAREPQDT